MTGQVDRKKRITYHLLLRPPDADGTARQVEAWVGMVFSKKGGEPRAGCQPGVGWYQAKKAAKLS